MSSPVNSPLSSTNNSHKTTPPEQEQESPIVLTRNPVLTKLLDYLELTKPRIAVLELVTVTVGFYAASVVQVDYNQLALTLLGTLGVAGSASAVNQWYEAENDAKMLRTAARPIASGRIGTFEALTFAAVMLIGGFLILEFMVNQLTALLGFASWFLYVVIYTPLKYHSTLNTYVGAVAGAIPILMGWAGTGEPLLGGANTNFIVNLYAASLFGVLFLWQFPHFMAIAWLYRKDYEKAGHKMLTVIDPTGIRPGALAVLVALILIPVSLVPALDPIAGSPLIYISWMLFIGVIQLVAAVRFFIQRDDPSARRLLQASLVYLPIWMGIMMLCKP